jgi:acyl-CoA reductase-like NAD-dependent aldehyde dehydrogenase
MVWKMYSIKPAATRLLVPASKLEEVNGIAKAAIKNIKVGNPKDADTKLPIIDK